MEGPDEASQQDRHLARRVPSSNDRDFIVAADGGFHFGKRRQFESQR